MHSSEAELACAAQHDLGARVEIDILQAAV
jgi:hypothetical protein